MRTSPLLRFWAVPTWCGDFRVERAGDDACLLTVEDPTPADHARLGPALTLMVERGMLEALPVIARNGVTRIPIYKPITEVGPLLAEGASEGIETWTAVRCVDNKISIVDGTRLPPVTTAEPVAAVTVKQPERGCPAPTAAERRASEVLRTFCTERQWAQFQAEGRMRVNGNTTGHAYFVHHRDEAHARGLSHALQVAATGETICAWDTEVPPEEEALALKFAVEHRERWLLRLDGVFALA